MESATASHESMYGEVRCDWSNREGAVSIHIKVPFGCRATLYLPKKYKDILKENEVSASEVGVASETEKEFALELVSGEYTLTA
jgi:alpha-L-rhamnosidase